ncbi:hypothetical protein ACFCP7_26210 [Paenibacillus elgii]
MIRNAVFVEKNISQIPRPFIWKNAIIINLGDVGYEYETRTKNHAATAAVSAIG